MNDLYDEGRAVRFDYLPPMSGISAIEDKLHRGAVVRRLGEGRTAEVLRNICHRILYPETSRESVRDPHESWNKLCANMRAMFGVNLLKPEFIVAKGYIQFRYVENNVTYDISSGGLGFLQTLLLFAYMYSSQGAVLLLDEPDAHLETIRQRETFQRINETARETGSQVLIATHSEVVLNEARKIIKLS
ncbi:MAG: ATP-binding protein [Prevotellaceae bacterium]|jgi:predicted ATPase|nr:ATP-binding protein [Prevotellaceae bacterium]